VLPRKLRRELQKEPPRSERNAVGSAKVLCQWRRGPERHRGVKAAENEIAAGGMEC